MDETRLHIAKGWVDKARSHLQIAQDNVSSFGDYSTSVQAAQVCIELSVKTLLLLLGIDYPKSHGWDREKVAEIALQIRQRNLLQKLESHHVHIKLPRFLNIANMWDQFYLQAKYGIEASCLATPQELFAREDAEFAIGHAKECLGAATNIRFLPSEVLQAVVANEARKAAS